MANDPIQNFERLVEQTAKEQGIARAQAMAHVCKAFPKAKAAYIEASNRQLAQRRRKEKKAGPRVEQLNAKRRDQDQVRAMREADAKNMGQR